MNMPQQPIINWKIGLTYFVPFILCSIAAFFICYIPVLQTLSGDIYTGFLRNRVFSSILSGILYPLFFTGLTLLIIDVVYRRRGIAGIPFSLWALAPFGLLVAVFGLLYVVLLRHFSVPSAQTEEPPYSIIFYDPVVIEPLALQSSPAYFFGSAGIGIILLLCFRPFRTAFRHLALAYLHHESFYHKMEGPEAETPALPINQNSQTENEFDEEIIEAVRRLFNTYTKATPSGDAVSVEMDIVGFVYGEGFDYAIFSNGYTTPFLFNDKDTVEDFHQGAFLHINTALYIRFDHILFIDTEELQIGVSPQLLAIFNNINRNRVKEKIQSYRDTEDAINCFHIHPGLSAKLQQAIDRFTG